MGPQGPPHPGGRADRRADDRRGRFRLTAQVIGAVSGVVSAILLLVLRFNLTPLATIKRMKLATARASLGHRRRGPPRPGPVSRCAG
jgi:hypothetical protein